MEAPHELDRSPVAAVEASLDASGQIDHLTPFIDVIKGAAPSLSESVDYIYR